MKAAEEPCTLVTCRRRQMTKARASWPDCHLPSAVRARVSAAC